jgi:hypothetical protein
MQCIRKYICCYYSVLYVLLLLVVLRELYMCTFLYDIDSLTSVYCVVDYQMSITSLRQHERVQQRVAHQQPPRLQTKAA